jgi:glycosyltransferase involved in cell wall biosynthesis
MQKGPDYFLQAAKRVLEKMDNVKFIMAGTGDMLYRTIEMAAGMGIGHKVLFTRFLHGTDVDKAYQMADLYVMPSVSEPFGIAPLEAMRQHVPVLISKQSGVSEVIKNALKVDFWDIDQMADKIIAVLNRPPLQETLRQNGSREVHKFRWEDSAARMQEIYENTLTNLVPTNGR